MFVASKSVVHLTTNHAVTSVMPARSSRLLTRIATITLVAAAMECIGLLHILQSTNSINCIQVTTPLQQSFVLNEEVILFLPVIEAVFTSSVVKLYIGLS